MITIVWNASSAHARLVKMKCFSCQRPNSPQYLCSISSMHSFSDFDDSPVGFSAAEMSGDRDGSAFRSLDSLEDVVGICFDLLLDLLVHESVTLNSLKGVVS
ncbi:hypothetical protein HKD37_12G034145 [Glycine soja]